MRRFFCSLPSTLYFCHSPSLPLSHPCRLPPSHTKISGDGLTRTRSGERPTIAPRGVLLQQGRWYYEVEIVTSGRATIGWGDRSFGGGRSSQSGLFAVGADAHSWGVDTFEQRICHNSREQSEIGSPRARSRPGGEEGVAASKVSISGARSFPSPPGGWVAGSVIGCLLELEGDSGEACMTWMLNGSIDDVDAQNPSASVTVDAARKGRSMRRTVRHGAGGFVPAISFESSFQFRVNFGESPFRFAPPTGARSIRHFVRSFMTEKFVASAGVRFGKFAVTTGNAHMNVEELRSGAVRLSARPSQSRGIGGDSEFPTAMLAGCLLTSGRWYYECRVKDNMRGGVWQLGYFDTKFKGSTSDGVGVGDDKHSWAYDGARKCIWHGLYGSTDWGSPDGAPKGTIVGVAVDLDAHSLAFFIDGKPADGKKGIAFTHMEIAHGLTPGVTFQNPTELVLNCGPGSGFAFDYTPPEGYRGVGEWVAAENTESALRTTTYSYWSSAGAGAGDDGADVEGASATETSAVVPPSPLRRTMSALTPQMSARNKLLLRCTSGHMQTLVDQQDRLVSASAHYISVVGDLNGDELLWSAAAREANVIHEVPSEGGGAAEVSAEALRAACTAAASSWYYEATVTRRGSGAGGRGGGETTGEVVQLAVGWATPRFYGEYQDGSVGGGVGGGESSWGLVEKDGRLYACFGSGASASRVPCASLSFEGGPITLELGSTVSCAVQLLSASASKTQTTGAQLEMRWAINGTWLDFAEENDGVASGGGGGTIIARRIQVSAAEALAHGGLRPAVSVRGGHSLQLNFGERALDYAEMLALSARTYSVHTAELRRRGLADANVDLGSDAGTELAAARELQRAGSGGGAVGGAGGGTTPSPETSSPKAASSSSAAVRRAPTTQSFAISQLEDAARRLREDPALAGDGNTAALLDDLDATIARLKAVA